MVMAGVLGACSSTPERVDAPIEAVYGRPDSTLLEVSIFACNASPKVTLTETSQDVRLHVTVNEGPVGRLHGRREDNSCPNPRHADRHREWPNHAGDTVGLMARLNALGPRHVRTRPVTMSL